MLLCLLLLVGCSGGGLSYPQIQQTAAVTGCWPDPWPTPRAQTVTPAPGHLPQTPLPTTTPLPRCAAAPGTTAQPWPTPVAALPPWPTLQPNLYQYGGGLQEVMTVSSVALGVDLAVHPTEGWPVVGAIQWSSTADVDRAFVRVFHPRAGRWGVAQNVDLGPSGLGRRTRTLAVGVTLHHTILAAWASPNWPNLGVWASASADYGTTWSPPQEIAPGCRSVLSMTTTLTGEAVLAVLCPADGDSLTVGILVRDTNGQWGNLDTLALPVWFGSEGSVQVVGAGDPARIVLVIGGGSDAATIHLASRSLAGGDWLVQSRPVPSPGRFPWRVRSTIISRPDGQGGVQDGVLATFAVRDYIGLYSLSSLDGGWNWSPVVPITDDALATDAQQRDASVPAYDPGADRFAVLWRAGADAQWTSQAATIYGGWSPLQGAWQTTHSPDGHPVPLTLGHDLAVSHLAGAQTRNGRLSWLAWVEGTNQVYARALDLNHLIPVSAYPTPTPWGGAP